MAFEEKIKNCSGKPDFHERPCFSTGHRTFEKEFSNAKSCFSWEVVISNEKASLFFCPGKSRFFSRLGHVLMEVLIFKKMATLEVAFFL